ESTGAPMLPDDYLAWPRCELRADLAAPCAVFEALSEPCRLLNGRNVSPGFIIAGTVSMMHCVEDMKPCIPCRVQDREHVRDAVVRLCDPPDARPDLATLGDEVVVWINHQESRNRLVIDMFLHGLS